MDCSLSGSSVHGIFQARVLEWVIISFSRGSSQPRNWTLVSGIAGRCFTIWATREALFLEHTVNRLEKSFHFGGFNFLIFFCLIGFLFWWGVVWPHRTACEILVPQPGIEPAVEAQILNHWTAREISINGSFQVDCLKVTQVACWWSRFGGLPSEILSTSSVGSGSHLSKHLQGGGSAGEPPMFREALLQECLVQAPCKACPSAFYSVSPFHSSLRSWVPPMAMLSQLSLTSFLLLQCVGCLEKGKVLNPKGKTPFTTAYIFLLVLSSFKSLLLRPHGQ